MKTLTTVSWMYQADSLCVQLASHGIEASIPDQGAMSALPLHGSALGGIRVQVDEEDFEKARDILRGISAVSAEQKTSCPKCGSLQVEYKRQSWFVAGLVVILVGIPLLWLKKKFQCHSCGHRWEEDPVKEETTEAEQPAVQVQSEGAFRLYLYRRLFGFRRLFFNGVFFPPVTAGMTLKFLLQPQKRDTYKDDDKASNEPRLPLVLDLQ